MHNIIRRVPAECRNNVTFKDFILRHPRLKFVSLVGIDFLGNDTDERIPVEYFVKHLDDIFAGGIQTDGSSVNLPGIATLSDAKVDFIIDTESSWFVDWTFESPSMQEDDSIGTVRIPIFFRHNNKLVCSRSVLKETLAVVEAELLEILRNDIQFLAHHSITKNDIASINFSLGTELEFWVRSQVDETSIQQLSLSQTLKEHYWKRTKGQVRTSLEECLMLLQEYGLEPEMGHKEVGGVKGKISNDGSIANVMEQLEIDWRFTTPLQAADNELFVRILVKEVFRRHGLEATVIAKPAEGVAGNGEHMHVGISVMLKNDKRINLFAPEKEELHLSSIGYSALMGLLKNWQQVNPFVTHSISALKRLQPGFESPVSVVASLGGNTPAMPSRNRTVLVGVVGGESPYSVRFEVRAPNPHTNTYLATAAFYTAMLDGIKKNYRRDAKLLLQELKKEPGQEGDYLELSRAYICEDDLFEKYTEEERAKRFGQSPRTVWEVIEILQRETPLFENVPLDSRIVHSFYESALHKWQVELVEKELPAMRTTFAGFQRFSEYENEHEQNQWGVLVEIATSLMRDETSTDCLLTQIETALSEERWSDASDLYLSAQQQFMMMQQLYRGYKKNILPFVGK
ncbi:glutamine synthetase [bacterium]|nr:glutamine synthetase [bacterium]